MAKAGVSDRDDARDAGAKSGTSRGRAKRGGQRKRGRTIVALVLLGFVLMASVVIGRRVFGFRRSKELSALERQRDQLIAERKRLEGRIRDESGRGQLGPAVARLGMQVPADEQVRILPR